MNKLFFLSVTFVYSLLASDLFYYNDHKKVPLIPLDTNATKLQRDSATQKIRYYMTPNQRKVGITNEIIVKTDAIDTLLGKHDLILVQELAKGIYLLQVPDAAETIDIANSLYNDKDVVFAHPNFQREIQKR